jgi:DNA-binding CsgD family transcriptional regulator
LRALSAAHDISSRLGAAPLTRKVESLAARAGIARELVADRRGPNADQAGLGEDARLDPAPVAEPATKPRGRYDLTPREREVLALVVAGQSDGEIGEALFISKKTASFHVAMIKGKLGARSRVEIATDAIGLGLIGAPAAAPPAPAQRR